MPKISKKLKTIGFFIAVFIFAILIFNGLNFSGGINKIDVKAATTDNVIGYAWSENIGWVSFNCTNTSCASSNYGVNLNGDNTLLGYAWSENIGWISFNAADVAAPVMPQALRTDALSQFTDYVNRRGKWCQLYFS